MDEKPTKILLIEDNPKDARIIRKMLTEVMGFSFELSSADKLSAGLERLAKGGIDVVLQDLLLPDSDGLDTFGKVQAHAPGMPIVILTALTWEELAVEAVKKGAQDFLIKGEMSGNLLVRSMRYAIERKRAERRLNIQYAVVRVLAESTTLETASTQILQAICESLEWDVGEIWVFDEQAKALRCEKLWHFPLLSIPKFRAVTKEITFAPGAGLPGRVWDNAKPVWIADVVHDANFLRASIADTEGLHGAFGFPIMSGSERLGVMTFFSREIQEPDKDLLKMMGAIGSQIGQFIKRKLAEEQIETSLKEKEVLLREVHHRVKNNMQIIISLLTLQAVHTGEEQNIDDILDVCQSRIKAMAIVHEKLYQTQDLASIDFLEYTKHLINDIFESFGSSAGNIELKVDIEDINLGSDAAILCGLILNELVSNSLKYAFPTASTGEANRPNGRGEISITMHRSKELNSEIEWTISDNGVGFPEDLDFRNTKTLGLQLVGILVEQLYGEITLNRGKGTGFQIKFNGMKSGERMQ